MEQKSDSNQDHEWAGQALQNYFSLPHHFLCTADKNGYFRHFNTGFKKVLGYSEDELKGQGLLKLIHPEDKDATRREMDKLAADDSRVTENFINRYLHKNGSYRWFTWCSCYCRKTDLLYGIGHDITEEKQIREKLESLLSTKDKLFSILAHDLRGTLEGVVTMAELLKDDANRESGTESMLEGLNLIASSARSTNELLDNQLNWFFMQLDTFKPNFVDLDISRCVKHGIDIYRSTATNKDIIFNVTAPTAKLKGDWNMLCIVFRNLISNAIKFSYEGSFIDIEIKKLEKKVTVSIRDKGMGIPVEIKSKLFTSGQEALRPGTNQEPSSGLGLQLCKEIVSMHKGKIDVESEEGKGTTFSISFPTKKA